MGMILAHLQESHDQLSSSILKVLQHTKFLSSVPYVQQGVAVVPSGSDHCIDNPLSGCLWQKLVDLVDVVRMKIAGAAQNGCSV